MDFFKLLLGLYIFKSLTEDDRQQVGMNNHDNNFGNGGYGNDCNTGFGPDCNDEIFKGYSHDHNGYSDHMFREDYGRNCGMDFFSDDDSIW